jgi:hypothetical protein
MASSLILPISDETQSTEGKNETIPESTAIFTVENGPYRIILRETYVKDAFYRVDATDEDNKYSINIDLNHFNGQDCKEYIQGCPKLFEKIFKTGTPTISIENDDMVCNFEGTVSAKIILIRYPETQIERMMKKNHRQDIEISKLKEQNTGLNTEVKLLVEKVNRLGDEFKTFLDRQARLENNGDPEIKGTITRISLSENKVMNNKELYELQSQKTGNQESPIDRLIKSFDRLASSFDQQAESFAHVLKRLKKNNKKEISEVTCDAVDEKTNMVEIKEQKSENDELKVDRLNRSMDSEKCVITAKCQHVLEKGDDEGQMCNSNVSHKSLTKRYCKSHYCAKSHIKEEKKAEKILRKLEAVESK